MFAGVPENSVTVTGQQCQAGDRRGAFQAERGGVANRGGVLVEHRGEPWYRGGGRQPGGTDVVVQRAQPPPRGELCEVSWRTKHMAML